MLSKNLDQQDEASVQAFRRIRAATRGLHCQPLDPRLASLCCREGNTMRWSELLSPGWF
jgi:hypothetical protein